MKIAASLLAADFARLGEDVHSAEQGGADRLHIDVMDGHFVPNITIGPLVLRAIAPLTALRLETHLMISQPEHFLDDFAQAGAGSLLVHYEGALHLHRTVQRIKQLGLGAGVVINPATPAEVLAEILPEVELVLVMTVNPGFGGQEFLQGTLPKIRRVREMIERLHPGCELEVDGGITPATAPLAAAAGADVFVAGTSVFGSPAGIPAALAALRQSLGRQP